MTTSGYTLLTAPVPQQSLVHVHAGVEELGRVYQPSLAINAGMPQFAARLAMTLPVEEPSWRPTLATARAEFEAWQQRPAVYAHANPALDLWEVVQILRRAVPEDAIITNGAGNFSGWAHRFWRYPGCARSWRDGRQHGLRRAGGDRREDCGARALRGGLCRRRRLPDDRQELATALQYGAAVLILVFNNSMYGTIRMHQEREFRARPRHAPDQSGLRAAGRIVRRLWRRGRHDGSIRKALSQALAFMRDKRLPALIELRTDPEVITPNATLSAVRATARLKR